MRTRRVIFETLSLSRPVEDSGDHLPGIHQYGLDRVALDFFSTFGGLAYGLEPVGSFDELVG